MRSCIRNAGPVELFPENGHPQSLTDIGRRKKVVLDVSAGDPEVNLQRDGMTFSPDS